MAQSYSAHTHSLAHALTHSSSSPHALPPSSIICPGKVTPCQVALQSLWLMCSDPKNPRLAGRVFVGGSIRKGGGVKVSTALTLIHHVCKALAPRWLSMLFTHTVHPGGLLPSCAASHSTAALPVLNPFGPLQILALASKPSHGSAGPGRAAQGCPRCA